MPEERISTKLFIPHPNEPGLSIVGILEQLAPNQPTRRKLALILHGTMGHKDYLFQKRLALRLPLDSFRFDFRGNHETGGKWKQGALDEDIEDLNAVVAYLKTNYAYNIELIVGHSRGSLVAFRWISTTEEGKKVPAFVNVSGRYRMRKILGNDQIYQILLQRSRASRIENPAAALWKESFAKQGYYTWNVTVARKPVTATIYPHDVEGFCDWDTSVVWDHFPKFADVLTIHGLADKTVPPYDALIYAKALGNRSPGTHTLHYMEDADHNFLQRQDEVVDVILQWLDLQQRGESNTGIWLTEIKGKL